ncbi:MAG TPA: tyrosine--tRNA ligase, partial [Clostridiales bacterium]|nr:tyrosine--tRNA ligase [Clostridiales bacterium]
FYQYWRNINDADVEKCLALLTFLPMEEVRRLGSLPGDKINEAKKVLAYEVTRLVHGEEEAQKAQNTAEALFGSGGNLDLVPTTEFEKEKLKDGINILDLIVTAGLVPSKAEGRRLISQGGLTLNDEKIDTIDFIVTLEDFKDGTLMLKKGKKTYHRVVLK